MELNIILAFTGGLASFLAPCVIPLLPAFISFISGVSFSEISKKGSGKYKEKILLNSLFYVLGFSLIFVLLGLSATTISRALLINRLDLIRIGGLLIIFFGLYNLHLFDFLGLGRREFKISLPLKLGKIKFLGPFLLGITFALAWTPCIGAILGGILTLAATSKNAGDGAILLFAYSLGISLPFIIIGLTLSRSYKFLLRSAKTLRFATILSGIVLVIIGTLMFLQKYELLTVFISQIINKF